MSQDQRKQEPGKQQQDSQDNRDGAAGRKPEAPLKNPDTLSEDQKQEVSKKNEAT